MLDAQGLCVLSITLAPECPYHAAVLPVHVLVGVVEVLVAQVCCLRCLWYE